MNNVLDLKNLPDESVDGATDIAVPAEESPEGVDAAALAGFSAPRTIAWEAHHPLAGTAQRKHFILLGALVGVGALVAWWQASIMVFLVALVGAGALAARERWSKSTHIVVDEHGVCVNDRRFAHTDFASFDIHRMPDATVELSLHTTRWHLPHFRLPLGSQDPAAVRTVMMQYIPEARHAIPFLDYFIRK